MYIDTIAVNLAALTLVYQKYIKVEKQVIIGRCSDDILHVVYKMFMKISKTKKP